MAITANSINFGCKSSPSPTHNTFFVTLHWSANNFTPFPRMKYYGRSFVLTLGISQQKGSFNWQKTFIAKSAKHHLGSYWLVCPLPHSLKSLFSLPSWCDKQTNFVLKELKIIRNAAYLSSCKKARERLISCTKWPRRRTHRIGSPQVMMSL